MFSNFGVITIVQRSGPLLLGSPNKRFLREQWRRSRHLIQYRHHWPFPAGKSTHDRVGAAMTSQGHALERHAGPTTAMMKMVV